MRLWPFRRPKPRDPEPTDEAREALRQAKRSLIEAERLDCAAQDIADRLTQTRDRNGFGAAVQRSMQQRRA